MDDLDRTEVRHAETRAMIAFVGCASVLAIICAAIIVSGWFAGAMTDRYERFFWAGAVLALVAVLILLIGANPGGRSSRAPRARLLTGIGLGLFGLAPLLCVGALIADFYG